mmetsp:Transcript_30876/g.75294  ORF Transcript_30876/g.75294 Transcript_30876/m.75294 type:complete len:89 (+) Transcript_30876:86-352(+)
MKLVTEKKIHEREAAISVGRGYIRMLCSSDVEQCFKVFNALVVFVVPRLTSLAAPCLESIPRFGLHGGKYSCSCDFEGVQSAAAPQSD